METSREKRSQELSVLCEQARAEAQERSSYKIGDRVRACRSPGIIHTEDGWKNIPHDHSNPDQHFDSRVLGWDTLGRIKIALPDRNPHSAAWCWDEKSLTLISDGEDWATQSTFHPEMQVSFLWQEPDFGIRFGTLLHATLVAPHLNEGEWWIKYQRRDGGYNTRVLHEERMILTNRKG